ncbi:hypothetical protein Hanom_Chr13g01210731 [Helianthus anomalus]
MLCCHDGRFILNDETMNRLKVRLEDTISCQRSGGVVGERFGVTCDLGSTPTLPIILCGIQVKSEYGWRRFVLDRRRSFIDYSIVVPSCGCMSGFRASGRVKRLVAVE